MDTDWCWVWLCRGLGGLARNLKRLSAATRCPDGQAKTWLAEAARLLAEAAHEQESPPTETGK